MYCNIVSLAISDMFENVVYLSFLKLKSCLFYVDVIYIYVIYIYIYDTSILITGMLKQSAALTGCQQSPAVPII